MKQRQNRPKNRAPHGSAKYSEQMAFWCAKPMKRKIMSNGGSQFVRDAVAAALRGDA